MPPLAHILAPQIMQRVNQIDEDLGRAGYLAHSAQANVGFEKTPYDPRGVLDKKADKTYDPRSPGGAMLNGIGIMQRSGDPIAQNVARAIGSGIGDRVGTQGGTRHGYTPPAAGQAVNPQTKKRVGYLAGAAEPIGMTERGEPVYAPAPASKTGKGGAPASKTQKLAMKRGQNVGFDETGESVDPRGKKLGYLASPTAPMGTISGARGELPLTDLARRKKDILLSTDKGTLLDQDAFGADALKQNYAEHLKAQQDHFGSTGTEAFPPGYFDGMSKEKRKNIELGVKALRAFERGQGT